MYAAREDRRKSSTIANPGERLSRLRFRAPPVAWTRDLRWVLLRAFGPEGTAAESPDPESALALAETLDLEPRIGTRHGRRLLEEELGEESASRVMTKSAAALGMAVRCEALAREVAAIAASLDAPVIFLKGAALHLSGISAPGSRPFTDVDVLTTRSRARELWTALVRGGCVAEGASEYEHQLPILSHAGGLGVEVHTSVLGVRANGERRSAEAGTLPVERVPGLPAGAGVPSRDALAAHAIVHGLAQHGSVPRAYPAFRMIADVADLSPVTPSAWASWISRDVPREEVDAVLALAATLSRGELPDGDGPAAELLAHLLAGALDDRYAASLRLGGVLREVTDSARLASVVRQAWHAAFPSAAELDRIYGPEPSRRRRVARRALRPFDIARRALRSAFRDSRSGSV